MKAIVYTQYGPPGVLQLVDVAKPTPKDDEVLIKVRAVSVNRSDWEGLRGKPLYARLGGLLRPRRQILGSDVAGRLRWLAETSGDFNQVMKSSETSCRAWVVLPSMFVLVKVPWLLVVRPNIEDFDFMKVLIEAGKVTPVIDKTYALSEVPEAIGYVGEGQVQGKVVITV
jgi:NADPH:quinone reductase-like Zn-dependent oxidoreductase